MKDLNNVYAKSYGWLKRRNFKGYDPYDGSNSKFKMLRSLKWIRVILVYFNKFSPINFRPILGIKKQKNPQAIALIIKSQLINPDSIDDNFITENIDYLISKSLFKKYGYHCWNGNDMDIQTLTELQKSDMPGIFGTVIIAETLFEYYKHSPQKNIYEVLVSIRDFILNELYVEYNNASFFKYKPITPKHICVYNVSILASIYILKINKYFNLETGTDKATNCFKYSLLKQNQYGYWNYSINLKTNIEKHQIDYHQGFILDATYDYLLLHPEEKEILLQYKKGLEFYSEKQFTNIGIGYYRYPKKYPINIHNQAQGVITFCKASKYFPEYFAIAKTILFWTTEKMFNQKGFFYYHKYGFFTNKISYIRWGHSWMLLAINFYKRSVNNEVCFIKSST